MSGSIECKLTASGRGLRVEERERRPAFRAFLAVGDRNRPIWALGRERGGLWALREVERKMRTE